MSRRATTDLHLYRLAEDRRQAIEDLSHRLYDLGLGETWAGRQTRSVLALIDDANERIEQLSSVWQALQRLDTGEMAAADVTDTVHQTEPDDERPLHLP